MTKCIYDHHDLDGICSAAIVNYKYNGCEMIPYFYGEEFPWHRFTKPGELVLMCDVSLPARDMAKLSCMCDLHWCDHHKSAIEACQKECVLCDGLQVATEVDNPEGSPSGCELTWTHLFPNTDMPLAVSLLGRYDVWDHKDPDVLPFQYGMRLQNPSPLERTVWTALFRDKSNYLVKQLIDKGRIILSYEQSQNQSISKPMCFPLMWEGVHFLAVNRSHINSKFFESQLSATSPYEAILAFSFDGKMWRVSMYSTPYKEVPARVLQLAKLNGGGGHAGACGFEVYGRKIMEILYGDLLDTVEFVEGGKPK